MTSVNFNVDLFVLIWCFPTVRVSTVRRDLGDNAETVSIIPNQFLWVGFCGFLLRWMPERV